ncbi:uncharacterized protein LOC123671051 [Harmonia axyridis]|uniref:uncharacterized protein LOC123671051 n=1 Tax=Harmonia axyridis TaxID=115357 RepID=UPI001E2774D2|nr:uncharacterized protein LOC123671051 [Harmonia axyridis]
MYLNHFSFVLVLVTVSASYFDAELPLYLSDDIIISKLPSISEKSTIYKIEKRDVGVAAEQKTKTNLNEKEDEKNKDSEIEDEEESGLVFIPSFGRRYRRAVSKQDIASEEKTKEKTGQNKKIDSEVENGQESGLVFLPSFGRRSRRSVHQKQENEDLLDSESNIVFLPSFKRNGFRRTRRDIDNTYYRHFTKRSAPAQNEDGNKKKETESSITEKNEELSDSDTVNGQESGLVFLPSFGRRSRRSITENRSTLPSTIKKVEQNTQAGNKPKTSATKTKREVETKNSGKKETKIDESDDDKDDELEEESGLVFIPSFGRRQRRDTSSLSSSGKTNVPSVQKDDEQPKKTLSTQESGLVFLPSFNRRTRRNVPLENKNKSNDKSDDPKKNDEEEQESGLVFLPSFGRRT